MDIFIPPTYEVCRGIMFSLFRSFVRSYARSFVRTFIRSSFRHWVKVFALKFMTSYFEDPLMDFIHIWHDGRYMSKVFISTIPNPGGDLGVKVTDLNFHKKVEVFCV